MPFVPDGPKQWGRLTARGRHEQEVPLVVSRDPRSDDQCPILDPLLRILRALHLQHHFGRPSAVDVLYEDVAAVRPFRAARERDTLTVRGPDGVVMVPRFGRHTAVRAQPEIEDVDVPFAGVGHVPAVRRELTVWVIGRFQRDVHERSIPARPPEDDTVEIEAPVDTAPEHRASGFRQPEVRDRPDGHHTLQHRHGIARRLQVPQVERDGHDGRGGVSVHDMAGR